MSRKRTLKFISLVVAAVFLMSFFAGCRKSGASAQVIKYNLGAEPKTIDPALNSAVESGTIIENAFEGLMKLDEKDIPVAGVAEKWDISTDGLKYTFHLRKDAKWSDGKAVTAKDFEYAWKRALAPETAAEYSYQLYYLKNGEAYNSKKATADQVGVKAKDDYTLEVELEYVTPYFLQLTAFPTYMPVRQDVVKANKEGWTLKGDTYVCNGPFKLKEWRPKDKIILEKNPNYWNSKNVKLETIEMSMLEQATSALSAFKSGQLDFMEKPPAAETPQLLKDGTAKVVPYLGTYFYALNVSDKAEGVDKAAAKALKDKRVRKALALAIDRKVIGENVTKAGEAPATTFVPEGIAIDKSGTQFKNKDYLSPTADVEAAKKLLAEAGYPNGAGFPKMTLMYNTGQGHQNIAQAVQDMWKKNLNINVELQNQEWKVFQKTRNEKNYLIARHGWIGDYVDPMTFLDMWASNSGQNDVGYNNPEYDMKISAAKRETDAAKRIQLLHDAEDLLMEDMPIIPIYYYKNIILVKDYVKGIVKSQLGFVYFDRAYIEK